ncbi:MAG: hypothetical protein K2M60_07050 [Lachnospiraceae bacterium]|nr:hypothetical protein [Lachnospiraceae bacterium]MDE6252186.1 hypothetical protein [Lachnospiraceae bacterium]
MKIKSLYVTQSTVIGLSDVPLETKDNIREAFEPIFKSKHCFTGMGVDTNGLLSNQICDNVSVVNAPFITQMGQLHFNKRSISFFPIYTEYEEYEDYEDYNVFGCDKNLEDQRMNFLYFELSKQFKMLAQYEGRTVASGKIFLHFYPTGYIVVHLAVYRRDVYNIDVKTEKDLLDLIQETKPWIEGKWKWKSKFGCHSLKKTIELVYQSISLSVFAEGKMTKRRFGWKASVAVKTDLSQIEISRSIQEEAENHFVEFANGSYSEDLQGILVAKKSINYYFADCYRDRNLILHSFWKINYINEFVLYKNKVYSDYLRYIQKDRNEMRNLNKDYKFKFANIVGKEFYRDTFFSYTQILDEYIKMLGSRYRAIYALFSKVDGFDNKRAKLKQELNRWENDIAVFQGKDKGLIKFLSLLINVRNILR